MKTSKSNKINNLPEFSKYVLFKTRYHYPKISNLAKYQVCSKYRSLILLTIHKHSKSPSRAPYQISRYSPEANRPKPSIKGNFTASESNRRFSLHPYLMLRLRWIVILRGSKWNCTPSWLHIGGPGWIILGKCRNIYRAWKYVEPRGVY